MTTTKFFLERYAMTIYFAMVIAISWGGVFLVVGPGGLPAAPEQIERQSPFIYLTMLAGPSIAGVLMTVLISGRTSLRELWSRLLKWRVGFWWYVAALLATPLLAMVTLFALLPTSPVFLPGVFAADDKGSVLLLGIVMGIVVGFFEELGWTGFATPRLMARRGVLATGLIVGLMWGVWHFILAFWASGSPSGALHLPYFLPWVFWNLGVLPVYRLLMVWIYARAGSLLLAVLMHASLSGGLALTMMPLSISGTANIVWYMLLTVVLWAILAAVAISNGGHLAPQTVRKGIS